ncbi:MAG: GGDEF domain-containing phosphodiesterase, partial [Pseudomonadota bacterium]|nr:GGDEF domain-containing phosphodiesterase [Pseudomonadota bacterium]
AKVLATLEKPVIVDDHKLFVTGSIGISLFPRDGQDVETLLKHADVALYRSKEQGRNSFHFYAPAMNARTLDRLLLERDLRQALEQEQLQLHYQPLLDLSSDRIASVEALLRWQHPQRGLLAPDVFIPLAEESGLIVAIGGWVLHTACAQIRAWQDAGLPPVRVAVNLSVRQLTQPDLVQRVGRVLHQTCLEPSRLTLEITESLLMKDIDKAAATLRALKAMGVRLAIDDFGTGYSSLYYLKHLPFDRLKIDKSLVRDIEIDPNDSAIAVAVIVMAHSLRLQVVAEGIEDEAQLAFLKSNGCDEGQGFHFSEPRPAADIAALLGGQRARRPASAAL